MQLLINDFDNIAPVHRKPGVIGLTRPESLWAVLAGRSDRLYACLDAAKIPNLLEVLDTEGIPHACLFDGKAAEDFASVAPWLAELPITARYLNRLFAVEPKISALWPHDAAIFLHSDADLESVRAHLRRLTKLPRADGQDVFFRFWDPGVAHGYLTGIAQWPDRIASLFLSRHARIDRIIVPLVKSKTARVFELSAPTAAGAGAIAPGLRLTDRDLKILADLQWPRLNAELCDWVRSADPKRFRGFDTARLSALCAHVIREGRAFGFRYKEEFAYLLYMMTFLGGWFHKAPQFSPFADLLARPGDDRIAGLKRDFPARHTQLYGHLGDPSAQMRDLWASVHHAQGQAGVGAPVQTGQLRALAAEMTRRLGWNAQQTGLVEAESTAAAREWGLADPHDIALHHLLWLSLGPYFLHDPLFPWAAEKFQTAPAGQSAMLHVALYAFRRLGRTLSLQKVAHA